ncbi:hypothetical protein BB559_004228 [Furculomyces boomerangus]|uniref:BD-FAE-like domain-containing protein n=2 Tax=Harpellales TaxID=61421 RepID=A0A2T9YFW8_9FUNG|nr:hypothetical protein BB559_004228 [Furculomyces boomerangus]PWA01935.1 hypothetical protein BB558_001950 [Smittium angustum]
MAILEIKDIPYLEDSKSPEHTLDLYIPERTSDSDPLPELLVYIHGGCWRSGDKADYVPLGRGIPNIGLENSKPLIAVAVINYILSKKDDPSISHPQHFVDCVKSIEFLAKNAAGYKYDSQKIHLCGHSAGGHLTGLITLDPPKTWWDPEANNGIVIANCIKSVIGVGGIYDHVDLVERIPSYDEFTVMSFGTDKDFWKASAPQNAPFDEALQKSLVGKFPPGFEPHGKPLLHVNYLVFVSTGDELIPVITSERYFDHVKSTGIKASIKADTDYGSHFGSLENPLFFDIVYNFITK